MNTFFFIAALSPQHEVTYSGSRRVRPSRRHSSQFALGLRHLVAHENQPRNCHRNSRWGTLG